MKTRWISGLEDKQDVDDVKGSYASSKLIRERLATILREKSNSRERASMEASDYDCPNWAYKQADAQGYKRALSEIISLLIEK